MRMRGATITLRGRFPKASLLLNSVGNSEFALEMQPRFAVHERYLTCFNLKASFTFKTTPRVRERMRTSRFVTRRAVLRAGVFHRCKEK